MAKSIIQQNARTGFAFIKFFIPRALELAESLCDTNTSPTEQSINLARTLLESTTVGESFVISSRQLLLCAGLPDELLDGFVDGAEPLLEEIRRANKAR